MSPLIIVGITLLTTALGDVSHVLQGQAHPPTHPQEAGNAFETKNAQDFWWMQDDSPFKSSAKNFKKCATGKCVASKTEYRINAGGSNGDFAPIDIQKNIFLNGGVSNQASSSSSFSSSSSSSFHNGVKFNLNENPFLNGGFSRAGHHDSSPSSGCVGGDRACVPKADCINGVIATGRTPLIDVQTKSDKCSAAEVCCLLSGSAITKVIVTGKSSIPGSETKVTDVNGLTVDQVQVLSASQEGIRPQLNFIGGSGSSTIKPIRDLSASASETFFSSTPDYSNVNFGDDARFSNLEGLDYLPPRTEKPTPSTYRPVPPSCAEGQYLTASGNCEHIHRECPPGTRATPTGGCEKLKDVCGPGEHIGPYGQCTPNATPPPVTCGPGQKLGPYGQCVPIPTQPPVITCGPGQTLGPYGQCVPIPTQPPVITCGPGQRPGPYGQCVPIPTQPPVITCGPGQKLGPYGQCIPIPTQPPVVTCGPGEKLGPYGQCLPIPTPPPVVTCGAGESLGPHGQCVPIPTAPPVITCGPGYKLSNGQCVKIATQPPHPVTCAPGQVIGPLGNCITQTYLPPTTQVVCGYGEYLGPFGQCVPKPTSPRPEQKCGPGERLGPSGRCEIVPTPRPACPPGSFPTASGGCQRPRPTPTPPSFSCPPGTVKSPSGRCESPHPPKPVTCPSGSFLDSSGICVRPTSPTTTRTYLPPETGRTTSGYHYPTPTPPFEDGSTEYSDYRPTDKIPSSGNNIPIHVRPPGYNDTVPNEQIPVGCAAALKCVQEIYCTAEGFVSPVPVVLTPQQELLKAPTTVCRIPESGSVGKCCRDLDYKDPWPSANLVNGVDDGQYAEDDSIGQYKAEYQRFSRASNKRRSRRISRSKRQAEENCGSRHLNSNPPGPGPIDADFAEISWQAMILRDSNRSLLCGGIIIRRNAVLTSAACVEGLPTSDILIKGGEWKLGIDEEPLPFQIVKVAAIARHPDFKAGSLLNNLAVLVLEENLRFTKNIGSLCLPSPNLIPTQNCIATGWGKRILQLHAKGAIMHRIDVDVMNVEQCQQVMGEHFPHALPNYNTNTLCGFSKTDQCRVDYGSALACADETGRYTLSGVYSWDTGCKQRGQIGAYVAPDVDWVETVLDTPLKQLKRQDRAYNNARLQAPV